MKKYMPLIALFVGIFVISACTNGIKDTDEKPIEENIGTEKTEEDLGQKDTEDEALTWIGKGIYQEKIDSQTIEIETPAGDEKYSLGEAAQEDLKSLEIGDEVSFLYYENDEYFVIESIREASFDWQEKNDWDHRYDRHNPRYDKNHPRNDGHHQGHKDRNHRRPHRNN